MVGSGPPAGLTDAMATLFGDLLGRPPTAARTLEKLTVRFGYRVVAGTREDLDGVVVLSPVTFRPAFPYDAGVPATLTRAVQAWLSAHAPAAGVDAW